MPASYKLSLVAEDSGIQEKAARVRHVRTPGGVRKYDQPIGAVITRDVVHPRRGGAATPKLAVFDSGSIAVLTGRGRTKAKGTEQDPIDVHGDIDRAVQLLGEGKHIRLNRPEEAATLIKKLHDVVADAKKRGKDAPTYDLCKVSVPHTNLFCARHKGVPRAKMPQIAGSPMPGSKAEKIGLERGVSSNGKVDLTPEFHQALTAAGVGVQQKAIRASRLHASQMELDGVKVAAIADEIRSGVIPRDTRITVTRDGYVLDGHHRWAAKVYEDIEDGHLGDLTIEVSMLDMDIGAGIDFANRFARDMGISPESLPADTFTGDDSTTGHHLDAIQAASADLGAPEKVGPADLKKGDLIASGDGRVGRVTNVDREDADPNFRPGISRFWLVRVVDQDGRRRVHHLRDEERVDRLAEADAPSGLVRPEEVTTNASAIKPGDQIADIDGDPMTVVAVRKNRTTGLYDITTVDSLGARDTGTFAGDNALARTRAAMTPTTLPLGVDVGRPVLATYQRRTLAALDLDHKRLPDPVRQAAARVRLRLPISAEQSAALAKHLSYVTAENPRQQRSLNRLAASIGAVDARLNGSDIPPIKQGDSVERLTVGDVTGGDWIALRAVGGGEQAQVGRVTEVRSLMGGRIQEITFTDDANGIEVKRLLTPDTTAYLLPELPKPEPVPDPESAKEPGPGEEISRAALRLGDTVSISQGGRPFQATVINVESVTDGTGRPGSYLTVLEKDGARSSIGVYDNGETTMRLVARATSEEGARLAEETRARRRKSEQAAVALDLASVGSYAEMDVAAVLEHFLFNDYGGDENSEYGKPEFLRQHVDASPEIKSKLESIRRDFARRLAGTLSGDLGETQREVLGASLEQVVADAQERATERVVAAIADVTPPKGRTYGFQRVEVAMMLRDPARGTPLLDSDRAAAKSLIAAAEALRTAGAPSQEPGPVPLTPEMLGTTATAAVARARAAMGGSGGGFGRAVRRLHTFAPTTLAELEAGKVPDLVTAEVPISVRAADKGPAETAMRHLDMVKQAGAAVRADVDRRIAAKLPTPEELQAQLAQVERDQFALARGGGGSEDERAAINARFLRIRRDMRIGPRVTPEMRSQARREALAELRPVGGHELRYDTGGGLPLETAAMRWAEEKYPTDWLAAADSTTIRLSAASRGYYSHDTERPLLVLSGSADPSAQYTIRSMSRVGVHELGHRMERMVPGLLAAEEAFFWSRTAVGEIGDRKRLPKTKVYEHDTGFGIEAGYKDDFAEHYTGKEYGGQSYELFTTGVESVFAGSPYMDGDTDFEDFMLGVLATL